MISFMFGVLGSILFWVCFFIVGFFMGTLLLKRIARNTFAFVTGKQSTICPGMEDTMTIPTWILLFIILFFIYTCWPIILFLLMIGFIIKNVFWKSFCSTVKWADEIIPNIEIKKKEKE